MPLPIAREADVIAYRLIEGEPLTRWALAEMSDAAQQAVADQLGAFLRALHAMPALDGIRVVAPEQQRARHAERRAFIEHTLTPHLMKYQVGYMRRLFDDALGDPMFSITRRVW